MARKRRKSLGKVKYYNRIFYTREQMIRKALGWGAAVLMLFAVGYLVGPAVIDLGTHTWYTQVKGRDLDAAPQNTETAPEATPTPAPTPTPEPTPPPPLAKGKWVFASLGNFGSPEAIAAAAQNYADQGVQYVVVPMKDSNGYLYYTSALPDAAGSVAAKTIDAAAVADALAEKGIIPVASICAFQDPIAVYTNRDMGIHFQGGDYMWLDNTKEAGGKPWADPWSPAAVNYVAGIIGEANAMGYKTVLVSGMQFPYWHDNYCGYAGGNVATVTRLADLIADWTAAMESDGCTLWFQYPLATVAYGKDVKSLAGDFDKLGVKNLLIALPVEPLENQEALLTEALANVSAENVAVKNGDSALFQ